MGTTEKGGEAVPDAQSQRNDVKKRVPLEKSKPGSGGSTVVSPESIIENMGSLTISPESQCKCRGETDNVSQLTKELEDMTITKHGKKEPTENDDDDDEFLVRGPPGEPTYDGDTYGIYHHGYGESYGAIHQYGNFTPQPCQQRQIGMKSQSGSNMVYSGVKSIHKGNMSGGAIVPRELTPPASPEEDSFQSLDKQLAVLADQMLREGEAQTAYVDQQEISASPSHSNTGMSPAYEWSNGLSPQPASVYPMSPESMYSSVGSPPASDVSNCGSLSPIRDDVDHETNLDDILEIITNDLEKTGETTSFPKKDLTQSTEQQIKDIVIQLQYDQSDQIVPSPPLLAPADRPSCAFIEGQNQPMLDGHQNPQHNPVYRQAYTSTANPQNQLSSPNQQPYPNPVSSSQFTPNNLAQCPVLPVTLPGIGNPNIHVMGTTAPGVLHVTAPTPSAVQTTAFVVNPTTAPVIWVPQTNPSVVVVQSPQLPHQQRPIRQAKPRKILPRPAPGEACVQDGQPSFRIECQAKPIKDSVTKQRPLDFNKDKLARARARVDQIPDDNINKLLEPDEDGDTQLMISIDNSNLEYAFAIITRCKNVKNVGPEVLKQVLDMQNHTKQTALFLALKNPDIVCMLLAHEADPTLACLFTARSGAREWFEPLHYCAYHGDVLIDSLCLLLAAQKKSNSTFINNKSTESWTPLHYAAIEHQRQVKNPDGTERLKSCTATIHTLIQQGANINIKDARGGLTPFHHIVKTGDLLLIESVLDMLTREVLHDTFMQRADANDESCLHFAVQLHVPDEKKAALVQLLVDRCPDLVPLRMRSGGGSVTAQGLVSKTSNPKVWEVLTRQRHNQSRSPHHY